jgi:hypothetical protein
MKRIAIQIEFETMDELRAYLAIPISVAPTPELVVEAPTTTEASTTVKRGRKTKEVEAPVTEVTVPLPAPVTPPPAPAPTPVTEVVVPTPPVPTLPPPPPTPSPIVTPVPGNGGIVVLLKLCSDLQSQGKLTQEMKDQAAQAVGLQDFKQIFLSPKADLVNQLATVISSMVA